MVPLSFNLFLSLLVSPPSRILPLHLNLDLDRPKRDRDMRRESLLPPTTGRRKDVVILRFRKRGERIRWIRKSLFFRHLFLTWGLMLSWSSLQRNWYLDPSTNLLHFPSSPLHPSHLAQSSNGVPQSMATGTSGGEEDLRELDRNKVVSATIGYAKELESIV